MTTVKPGFTVQVFDPTPDHKGWHEVVVINELECGWIFAVGEQSHPDAETALVVAGMVGENTGARTRAFDVAQDRPITFRAQASADHMKRVDR